MKNATKLYIFISKIQFKNLNQNTSDVAIIFES